MPNRNITTVKPLKIRSRAKIIAATEEMVEGFEQKLGTRLPAEYSAFLREYNGGVPNPAGFSYQTPKGKLKKSGIEVFFHLGNGAYSLESTVKSAWKNKTVPKQYLPIALDIFGDFICLPLAGKDSEKVKFCPTDLGLLEMDIDGYPSESSTTVIASDFTHFMTKFCEIE